MQEMAHGDRHAIDRDVIDAVLKLELLIASGLEAVAIDSLQLSEL